MRRRLSARWTTSTAYQRGLMGLDGVANPLATNTLSVDLNGFFGMRTSVLVRPTYTWGADLADPSQSFHSATGIARMQFALNRRWAAYGEYIYYDHAFSHLAGIRPSLAADTRRNGLRTGLALWSPLR
jgi:hypothetical protein